MCRDVGNLHMIIFFKFIYNDCFFPLFTFPFCNISGDFAVMLKAGMSIKQALAVQGVSSVLAYVGMALGVAVGNITSASVWMFAFAAGMFLYIALVDLVSIRMPHAPNT